MKLSILICSLHRRLQQRAELLKLLKNCIGPHRYLQTVNGHCGIERYSGNMAEIIVATDNKQLSVGAKRNLLVELAQGSYVAFVDDDDMVSADYAEELLAATLQQADVIVFDAVRYENGAMDRRVSYDKNYLHDYNRPQLYYRIPNHLMCFKRELAGRVKYGHVSFGEDADWARRVLPYIRTQHRIYKTLYEYWFDSTGTETQK